MLKPQTFGFFIDEVGTCALGAANEAMGLDATADAAGDMSDDLGLILGCRGVACPVDGCTGDFEEADAIVHLNDKHRWTRERIADWVQTIEDAHATPIETPKAVEVDK